MRRFFYFTRAEVLARRRPAASPPQGLDCR
jgi:hypothetical protein